MSSRKASSSLGSSASARCRCCPAGSSSGGCVASRTWAERKCSPAAAGASAAASACSNDERRRAASSDRPETAIFPKNTAVKYALSMYALILLLAVPTLELQVDHPGSPEAALVVRVKNPAGHRPVALLRQFWKYESIQCALVKDGQPVPPAVQLKPDRPTLAQLVVLEPATEYGERIGLSHLWGTLT